MKKILKGGKVFINGGFVQADLLYDDRIISISPTEEAAAGAQEERIDGKVVLPGLVDVHVHFREPGFPYKETMATGSAAAAHGGYTTVFTMPNLDPAPDSPGNVEEQLKLIREQAVVKIIPYGAITVGQKGAGELSEMEGIAPVVCAFSDDGRGVQADGLMEQAMRKAASLDKHIVAHCEVDELIKGGYIHDGEYARRNGHKGICSESEWRQVERDIELARTTGCEYHICHVSTKQSVELVRSAKAQGVKVTCETAPHYLLLTDEDLLDEGRFKMNPPIRSAEDCDALLRGIADGTVDVIATDHAPHSAQEKSKGLAESAMGIVGLETALPLLYTYLVKKEVITMERLMELMSYAPRRIFRLEGALESGAPADFTVFDLEAEYAIDPEEFLTKGRATPFQGWTVRGRCEMTVVDGKTVYKKE